MSVILFLAAFIAAAFGGVMAWGAYDMAVAGETGGLIVFGFAAACFALFAALAATMAHDVN